MEIHKNNPSLLCSESHWPVTLLSVVKFAGEDSKLSLKAFSFVLLYFEIFYIIIRCILYYLGFIF